MRGLAVDDHFCAGRLEWRRKAARAEDYVTPDHNLTGGEPGGHVGEVRRVLDHEPIARVVHGQPLNTTDAAREDLRAQRVARQCQARIPICLWSSGGLVDRNPVRDRCVSGEAGRLPDFNPVHRALDRSAK